MIEITVGDCGCSVSQYRASPLTVTINYCSKHAAVDAVYEALKDLITQPTSAWCDHSKAHTAIALADGKEVE